MLHEILAQLWGAGSVNEVLAMQEWSPYFDPQNHIENRQGGMWL